MSNQKDYEKITRKSVKKDYMEFEKNLHKKMNKRISEEIQKD